MVIALCPSFARYMESTRHVRLYRLDSSYMMPALFQLPQVEHLSLIQCSPLAVGRILQPASFPSLQRIEYLSSAPSDTLIHRRFKKGQNKMDWVFPAADYPFYNAMMEAGHGRKDESLIRNVIAGEKMIDGSRWFDLYIPSRSIVCGEWYYQQQMAYFHKKHCDDFQLPYPLQAGHYQLPAEGSTSAVVDSRRIYQQKSLDRIFLKTINHPDATPCHSSST